MSDAAANTRPPTMPATTAGTAKVRECLSLQLAACDQGHRIVQICVMDHAVGHGPIPHLHLMFHLGATRSTTRTPWVVLGTRSCPVLVADLHAALAELPGPRPRLHMHENTTTKPTEKTYAEQLPRGSLADPSLLADRACPICLEGFVAGDELVVLPCQGLHVSHSACLQPWLVKAHTCPTCRFELPTTAAKTSGEMDRRLAREESARAEVRRLSTPPTPPTREDEEAAAAVMAAAEEEARLGVVLRRLREAGINETAEVRALARSALDENDGHVGRALIRVRREHPNTQQQRDQALVEARRRRQQWAEAAASREAASAEEAARAARAADSVWSTPPVQPVSPLPPLAPAPIGDYTPPPPGEPPQTSLWSVRPADASAGDQSSFVRNPGVPLRWSPAGVPLQTGAASAEQEHSRTKFVARGRGSPAPTVLPTRSERSDRERPRAGGFRFYPRLFSRR